jgi:hypothetical protein
VRTIKVAFIAVMALLLALPGLQMIYPFVGIPGLEEYRRLAPLPDPGLLFSVHHASRSSALNAWFNDNMGFRPLLTRFNNQVDYSAFAYSRRLLVGKDGWFFDREWIEKQLNQERLGERLQQQLREKTLMMSRCLAERNVKLVMVSIPASWTVYPEFLPADAPKLRKPTPLETFSAFLKTRADLLYVDGADVLIPAKSRGLYLKTDHHFNEIAAYLLAQALASKIAEAEGRPDVHWEREPHFVPIRNWSGNLERFLSVFDPPLETNYATDAASTYDDKHPPAGQSFTPGPPPFEFTYRNDVAGDGKLPPIVIFGNSFADGFVPVGMYEFFRGVYRVRGIGQDELEPALRSTPGDARYFVFQFIEPYLDALADAKIDRCAERPVGAAR